MPESRMFHAINPYSIRRILTSCLVAVGLVLCGPAAGQSYCSEPVEPYCISTDSEFDSLLQVNRCEDDLTDFEEQVNEYEECITGQVQAMRDELTEARQKLVQAKEDF